MAPHDPRSGRGGDDGGGYLAIAQVAGPHGIRGELRCSIITDFPDRFRRTRQVLIGERKTPYAVDRARLVKDAVILKLREIDSRAEAELLRGLMIYVPEEDAVSLEEGSFFWHQVIGLRVESTEGQALGTVRDILQTGSNDVYVVRSEEGELLLPAIHDVIRGIDLDRGVMTVELVEGLR